MRTMRLVLIAAVLAPATTGCSWIKDNIGVGQGNPPKGTGPLEYVPPERLVGYLNERASRMQTLQYSEVRARVSGEDVPMAVTFRGDLAAAQPRSFRMSGQASVGAKLDL